MNSSPIILLVGQAGSGKDTVAGYMVKNHGALSIAQADPMKRLARIVFDFNEDQLWGPSSSRNAVDERYNHMAFWEVAWNRFHSHEVESWLMELFDSHEVSQRFGALKAWMNMVQTETHWKSRDLTPRFVLQTLGTEWGRNQGRDLWSKYTIRRALDLLGGGFSYDRARGLVPDPGFIGPDRVVISDGRFRNEVVNVRAIGGAVVRIDSPNTDSSGVEAAGVAGHASEKEQKGLPGHFFTGFLLNDKAQGLSACEAHVKDLIRVMDRNYVLAGYSAEQASRYLP
jgi:hypothetical protein